MTGRSTRDEHTSLSGAVALALVILVAGAGVLAGVAVGAPTADTSAAGESANAAAPQPTALESTPADTNATNTTTNTKAATDHTGWPMHGHDPAHTGSNPGTRGPGGTIGLARTIDGAGTTYSGAIVVDGTLYYTSGGNDAGWQAFAYAVDVETGEQLWRTRIGPEEGPAVPALAGGTLYVAGSTSQDTAEGQVPIGELYAIDAATGDVRWTVETPVDSYTNGAIVSSPTVADGTVYFGSNNDFVYAVDARTGQVQWRYDTGLDVQTSPAVANGRVYVGANSRGDDPGDSFFALDAATGAVEWSAAEGQVTTTPTVADGKVFVLTADDLVAFDAASGARAWTRPVEGEGYYRATMVAREGTLYYPADGDLHAVSTADGSERWTAEGVAEDSRTASPSAHVVAAADTLYVSSNTRDAVTAVDPESGTVLGSATVPSTYRLAIAEGRVVVTELHGDVHLLDEGPRATVAASSTSTATGQPVTFDASGSGDPDGTVESYAWDVDGPSDSDSPPGGGPSGGDGPPGGDGPSGDDAPDAEGVQFEHTFGTAGTYEVTLTVVDDDGIANSTTVTVEVGRALVARVDATTPVTAGEEVTLDATGTRAVDGPPTYRWDLDGDGEPDARGEQVTTTFDAPGYYGVGLQVTSQSGTTDNATAVVLVQPKGGTPTSVQWGSYRASGNHTGVVTSGATAGPESKPRVAWSAPVGSTDGGGTLVAPVVAYGRVYAGLGGNLTAVGDWRRGVQGQAWLSPAAAGGRLFVTTGDAARGGVLAVDPATGETLWNTTWRSHKLVFSTPVATNETVFVTPSRGTPSGGTTSVVALAATDGSERWNASLAGATTSSPALADGTVYVLANTGQESSQLSALDAASGAVEWQTEFEGISLVSSPAIADGRVYVASRSGGVRAFDAADGTERWSALGDVQFVSTPAVSGGAVYATAMDGTVHVLDAASGEVVWNSTVGREILGSATIVGDRVYVATTGGTVVALDAASGDPVWNVSVPGGVISDPVVAGGAVLVVDTDGRLVALTDADAGGSVSTGSLAENSAGGNGTASGNRSGNESAGVDSVPTPGFGPVVALLAVGLVVGLLRRRS